MIFYPSEPRQAYIKTVQAAAKSLKRITLSLRSMIGLLITLTAWWRDGSFFLVIRRGAAILANYIDYSQVNLVRHWLIYVFYRAIEPPFVS